MAHKGQKRSRLRIRKKNFSCRLRRCWKKGCTKTFNSWEAVKRHDRYMHGRILFEKKFVTLCLRQFGIKRLKLRADQLVRHFTHAEIRRAAGKLMKKKQALNF